MQPLDLIEIGLASAFNEGLAATADLLADGRSPLSEHGWFRGRDYEPQIVSFTDPETLGRFEDRVLRLAEAAIADLLARAGADALGSLDRLVILLPEPGEGLDAERLEVCGAGLAARLASNLEVLSRLRSREPDIMLLGHGGLGPALQRLAAMDGGDALLVAVDSFNDGARLNAANDGRRALFCRDNRYGFMPGEAAAAALVRTARRGSRPLARILGIGVAEEPASEHSGNNTTFPGLSEAALGACDQARELLGQAGLHLDVALVEEWFSDWNNSRYRAAELAVCAQRLQGEYLPQDLEIEHPALRLGDLGAAGPLAAIGLFGEKARRSREVRRALVTGGSWESGLRAAFVALSSPAQRSEKQGA